MYSCEATCKKCGHMALYTENELWRIISIANDLEVELKDEEEKCNICGVLGPMKLVVRNEGTSLVVFEKIISPTPTIGKSPLQDLPVTIHPLPKDFNVVYNKPTMDNPCIVCCATGKLEIQYKAHKKEGDFKGVLVEECPMCDGKGYFK